ncbi:class II aldolase/adducin family protein [Shimia sp. CNT1-13L.2]|uniref:class II aldolase/adducin family protein n=1 Tax=Shimia sp. CNT1-13L.2 TaxID=2959663 RepID=UPI0020CFD8E0|nr:class II aldolase/adducin family protein [Shimia sp. CNT1-13L.2]MCP9483295.1 class II aldolase/adducin family protein [Shimia sp. CNT1-13L.2]
MSGAIRRELAALYRLAHHYGWTDLTSTHISARLPDDPEHYLLNSHDLMFDEITASNLTRMSFDGHAVDDEPGSGRIVNLAGHIIHSGILSARPEVNFVIHSHTRAGVAVSAMPGGLLPLSQHAGFVLGTLSSHPYQDSTAVADEGALLARDLGDNYAMLLQNHGLLVVGRTAAEAFQYHYYLEMACKIQVDILAGTDRPIEITPDAMAALHDWGAPANGPHGGVQWPSLMRMLERTVPEYRE